MKKLLSILLVSAIVFPAIATPAQAQQTGEQPLRAIFSFVPPDDGFQLSVGDNRAQLERLCQIFELSDIASRKPPVVIDVVAHCSVGSYGEKLSMAMRIAKRVKSTLIERCSLKEANFKTVVRTVPFEGQTCVVVVSSDITTLTYQVK